MLIEIVSKDFQSFGPWYHREQTPDNVNFPIIILSKESPSFLFLDIPDCRLGEKNTLTINETTGAFLKNQFQIETGVNPTIVLNIAPSASALEWNLCLWPILCLVTSSH